VFDAQTRNLLVALCMLAVTGIAGSNALAGGNLTDSSDIADLIYDPTVGNVWLNAKEAAGGIITTFQFENEVGTFRPENYIGPTGGTFGGGLEDISTMVLADTDFTLSGFSGTHNFGNIFPAGMTLVQLQSYLEVAVYTGRLGSPQQEVDLQLISLGDADTDGDVDAADYIAVKTHMGMTSGAQLSDGDFDSDNDVDWYDLQILLDNYGSPGASSPAPEPTTLGLLTIGALAVIRRRRK